MNFSKTSRAASWPSASSSAWLGATAAIVLPPPLEPAPRPGWQPQSGAGPQGGADATAVGGGGGTRTDENFAFGRSPSTGADGLAVAPPGRDRVDHDRLGHVS